jgi:hypothetical protein
MDDASSSSNPPQTKQQWIENTGTYHYYALILANFNPNSALDILDNPADVIAQAYVSMKCYDWSPKKDTHGR